MLTVYNSIVSNSPNFDFKILRPGIGVKIEGEKISDVTYEHYLTLSKIFHPVFTFLGDDLVAGGGETLTLLIAQYIRYK